MPQIISHLLIVIQYQAEVIKALCALLFGKNFKPKPDKMTDEKHLKLSVDPLPIFEKPKPTKIYDCNELIAQNNVKPVKSRGGNAVPSDTICPYCGATHDYIYDNNGGRGQFLCKVCKSTFFPFKPTKDDEPYCPFCGNKLVRIKERKDFDIYRCNNRDCSFRKKKLSAMNSSQQSDVIP